MYSLWLLLAMVLAAPLYYVWQIRRFGRRELRESIPSISEPSTHPGIVLKSTGVQTRMMKWISIGEFMAVLTKCSDLIVIDLRTCPETSERNHGRNMRRDLLPIA